MSTPWIIFIIVLVLAIILSNILLLKKSAHFDMTKKTQDKDKERAKPQDKDQ
ncbi:MAG: hypothetical protein ACI9FJ_001816 [Alteromonadaceae bacterium]|jgi:uncharacterized protein YpmB